MIEAVLFDIDGTLISTGGAGAIAWRRAFQDLHGTPLDIREVTESGMTDPEVGQVALRSILAAIPVPRVGGGDGPLSSPPLRRGRGVRGLPGDARNRRAARAPRRGGHLLGLTTGNVEAAAHIKLARAGLNRFFSFGGYGSDSNERIELTRCALAALSSSPAAP